MPLIAIHGDIMMDVVVCV